MLGPNGAGKSTLLLRDLRAAARAGGQRALRRPRPRGLGAARDGAAGHRARHRGPPGVHPAVRASTICCWPATTCRARRTGARIEEGYALFPEIAAKRDERGGALSGGQQQMLAVAQGLVRRPRLLMLDEPSAGLSPVLVDRVLAVATALAGERHLGAAGRAVGREGAGVRRPRLCAGRRARSCWRRRPPSPTCRSGSERAYFGRAAA